MNLPDDLGVHFLFPTAPRIPVTINGGYVMPAWYDIRQTDLTREVDEQGILQSARYLHDLVEQEIARGVPAERIILAGFSQGGAVALAAALAFPSPLLGVIALSCYLPLATTAAHPVAVFQAHGRMDGVVPYPVALETRERLLRQGVEVAWHEYDMAHSVCPEEVADIRDWIVGQLSAGR